jgi:hypothetical protein
MKYKNPLYTQLLITSAYVILIYLYVFQFINPELHYHAQQPPFQETMYFFNNYLTFPGGLAEYFSTFLAQFFYFGWLGSTIIVVFGLLIILLTYNILRTFECLKVTCYALSLAASTIFIALLNNYYFPLSIALKILLVYSCIYLFLQFSTKSIHRIIAYLIVSILLYYIAGGGALIMFSISLMILSIRNYGLKASGIFFALILVITIALPYVAYKFVFSISLITSYLNIIQDLPVTIAYENNLLLVFFVLFLPLILIAISVISYVKNKREANKLIRRSEGDENDTIAIQDNFDARASGKTKWYSGAGFRYLIAAVTILAFAYFIIQSTRDDHKRNIVLADYFNYHQNYNGAINVALSDTTYDIIMNLSFNNAIDNAGRFVELFFAYPQYMGIDGLYPDRLSSAEFSLLISDYYFNLGYVSKAQHWANATLVLMPYNIRALQRLALTNLIYGNYMAAQTILNVISNNFISRDFARHYLTYIADTTLAGKDALIAEKRAIMPRNIAISENIADRLFDLIAANDNNKNAYEHLEIGFLLEHQLGYFIKYLVPSTRFYKKLPAVYEQAIMMYMSQVKQPVKIRLSKISQNELVDFIKIMKGNNTDKEAAKPFLQQYKNTYMYYVIYNSPLVTGKKLNRQYIQVYK